MPMILLQGFHSGLLINGFAYLFFFFLNKYTGVYLRNQQKESNI